MTIDPEPVDAVFGADEDRTAVILVDHGSTRAESNDQLVAVAEAYRRRSGRRVVEPAHMELAEPSIAAAFARCVEQGATLIVVCPYFLAPGKHWTEDIPRLAAEAASPYPGVRYSVAEPLGLDPLMLELIEKRVVGALGSAVNTPDGDVDREQGEQ